LNDQLKKLKEENEQLQENEKSLLEKIKVMSKYQERIKLLEGLSSMDVIIIRSVEIFY